MFRTFPRLLALLFFLTLPLAAQAQSTFTAEVAESEIALVADELDWTALDTRIYGQCADVRSHYDLWLCQGFQRDVLRALADATNQTVLGLRHAQMNDRVAVTRDLTMLPDGFGEYMQAIDLWVEAIESYAQGLRSRAAALNARVAEVTDPQAATKEKLSPQEIRAAQEELTSFVLDVHYEQACGIAMARKAAREIASARSAAGFVNIDDLSPELLEAMGYTTAMEDPTRGSTPTSPITRPPWDDVHVGRKGDSDRRR